MTVPARYAWLAQVAGLPRIIDEAFKLYGTLETPGTADNPVIEAWAREVGGAVADVYKADSIPWCGLFAAVVVKRAGKNPPRNPLWALSWSAFGVPVDVPMLGDVLVYKRQGGGHVNFYVGEDEGAFHGIGGNQSDGVNVTRIARSRLYAARRPEWVSAAPAGRRRFRLTPSGPLSTNEA